MDDGSSRLIILGSRPKGEPSLLAGYPCKNLKTHNHLSDDCEHCVRLLSFSAESLAKAKPLREQKEKYNAWRRTGVMRLEIKILLLTREQFSSALLPPEQQSLRFSTWKAKRSFCRYFFVAFSSQNPCTLSGRAISTTHAAVQIWTCFEVSLISAQIALCLQDICP